MASGDVYRLSVEGRGGPAAEQVVCVFHYQADVGTIFDTQTEDLIQAWKLAAEAAWRDTFSNAFGVERYNAVALDGSEFFELTQPFASFPGTRSGDALPPQVCPILSWKTGVPGRARRGRTYCWPASEADNVAGTVQTGLRGDIADFADIAINIGDGLTTATYSLVVWSSVLTLATPVTTYVVRPSFGTQRRRRAGVGS